jgi:hypothetical protein
MANTKYTTPYIDTQNLQDFITRKDEMKYNILFISATIIGVLVSMYLNEPFSIGIIILVNLIIYVIRITLIYIEPNNDTKQIGDIGERMVLDILASLPDEYTVINDLRVPNPQSKTGNTQIDFVVIGPNGCFVVEVKYHRGMIVNTQDRWVVTKTSIKGHQYTKEIRNPMKQVVSQIKALRSYTKTIGYTITVNPIIYFAHPTSSVHCQENNSIAVIHLSGLTSRILETPKPRYLSERTIQRFKEDMIRLKQAQTEEKKEEDLRGKANTIDTEKDKVYLDPDQQQ